MDAKSKLAVRMLANIAAFNVRAYKKCSVAENKEFFLRQARNTAQIARMVAQVFKG